MPAEGEHEDSRQPGLGEWRDAGPASDGEPEEARPGGSGGQGPCPEMMWEVTVTGVKVPVGTGPGRTQVWSQASLTWREASAGRRGADLRVGWRGCGEHWSGQRSRQVVGGWAARSPCHRTESLCTRRHRGSVKHTRWLKKRARTSGQRPDGTGVRNPPHPGRMGSWEMGRRAGRAAAWGPAVSTVLLGKGASRGDRQTDRHALQSRASLLAWECRRLAVTLSRLPKTREVKKASLGRSWVGRAPGWCGARLGDVTEAAGEGGQL